MKKSLMILALSVMTLSAAAQAPAFPGAEGHGRYVTGGRGGKVVHVTNLNDSGTGSFREAVNGSSKKIVVFDVAGVIPLKSDLTIGANTTIEGQTAPAPGITLRYYTLRMSDNVIMRFIRVRRGEEMDVNDGADAIWDRQLTGIMIDHCSFSWCIDEVASFYDNNNFTMQWSTIAESLTNAGHNKGAHGYGGIWGGKLASFHHNLIAHVTNRGPRFNGARYGWTGYTNNLLYDQYNWSTTVLAENVDFRNCVMYNSQGACYGGPGGGQINMVNNYYKAGPRGSGDQNKVTLVTVSTSSNSDSKHPEHYGMTSRYYISGNTTEKTSGEKNEYQDWAGVGYDSGVYYIDGEVYSADDNNLYTDAVPHITTTDGRQCVRIRLDEPAPTGEVTTHAASTAFEKVMDYCGASLNRDDVDLRYMEETRNGIAFFTGSVTGQPGLIDVVADVSGYTEKNFGTGAHPTEFDTDNDGIPDDWEIANGLNPKSAIDALKYTLDPKGWYTNIEVYCNSLVQDIMLNGNADAEDAVTEYYPRYVKADGTVVEAINSGDDAISQAVRSSEIAATYYYNMQGVKIDKPSHGIYIRVDIFTDGNKVVSKQAVR